MKVLDELATPSFTSSSDQLGIVTALTVSLLSLLKCAINCSSHFSKWSRSGMRTGKMLTRCVQVLTALNGE